MRGGRSVPGAKAVQRALRAVASEKKAAILRRFFKTGPGEYGEGDRFLGVVVPALRRVACANRELPASDLDALLDSPIHEERLVALLILVEQFERAEVAGRRRILRFYLARLDRVNNWDLVDLSAPKILGVHCVEHPEPDVLLRLARSPDLWRRRVSIVSTFTLIRAGQVGPTLDLAEVLLGDPHDLLHKACGWMLREVGKREEAALTGFLDRFASRMPRTMLRYAIERMPEAQRRDRLLRSRTSQ